MNRRSGGEWRSPKQEDGYTLLIKRSSGTTWINSVESIYSNEEALETESIKEVELKEKIRKLQMKLKTLVKVAYSVHALFTILFSYLDRCSNLYIKLRYTSFRRRIRWLEIGIRSQLMYAMIWRPQNSMW